MIGYCKVIVVHALHILLDYGFQFTLHGLPAPGAVHQVHLQQTVALEAVESGGACAIELQQVFTLHKLVDAIVIVDSKCVVMRGVEQVAAKSNVRAIVAEIAQHGRHNVGVLCNLPVVNATAQGGVAGSIEHNRHRELSEVGLIHIPARLAGVVGCNHE